MSLIHACLGACSHPHISLILILLNNLHNESSGIDQTCSSLLIVVIVVVNLIISITALILIDYLATTRACSNSIHFLTQNLNLSQISPID